MEREPQVTAFMCLQSHLNASFIVESSMYSSRRNIYSVYSSFTENLSFTRVPFSEELSRQSSIGTAELKDKNREWGKNKSAVRLLSFTLHGSKQI